MLAFAQRNKWRDMLKQGKVPFELRGAVQQYKMMRDDVTWRSTAMYEVFGEAACVLVEILDLEIDDGK